MKLKNGLAVSCAIGFPLLLCTVALAGLATGVGPWVMEFTTAEGQYSRMLGYPSKESCEAAIPEVLQKQSGYNGHCIEWKDDHFIGSWDPVWAEKNQH